MAPWSRRRSKVDDEMARVVNESLARLEETIRRVEVLAGRVEAAADRLSGVTTRPQECGEVDSENGHGNGSPRGE